MRTCDRSRLHFVLSRNGFGLQRASARLSHTGITLFHQCATMKILKDLSELKTIRVNPFGFFLCEKCGKTVKRSLRDGLAAKSCGCLGSKGSGHHSYHHGFNGHRLYAVWRGIKARCLNPSNSCYHRYGGRGIKICSEWMDAGVFCNWALANGWRQGLDLDRIDNNGNYEPQNCRFVTHSVNCKNR